MGPESEMDKESGLGKHKLMMFNSDMCLAYNTNPKHEECMVNNFFENRKCKPERNCEIANGGCGDDKYCQDEARYFVNRKIEADPLGPRCKPINALDDQKCCAWTHKKEIYERGVYSIEDANKKKIYGYLCGGKVPYKGKAASFKRTKLLCCEGEGVEPRLDRQTGIKGWLP